MIRHLSDKQIEHRLNSLEAMIARANYKDLPSLNRIFQILIDEQVRRDLGNRGSGDTNRKPSGKGDGKSRRKTSD